MLGLIRTAALVVLVVVRGGCDAYGAVVTTDHIHAHAYAHLGHKCLFADRLDVGVSAGGSDTPRLVPFAQHVYQNRNRAYSPALGRYLQRDPNGTALALLRSEAFYGRSLGQHGVLLHGMRIEALLGDGANLYAYLGSNPWTRTDPFGLQYDPFDMLVDYLIESALERSEILSRIGASAHSLAVIGLTAVSFLPVPFVGSAAELGLWLIGEQSLGAALAWGAVGLIPGAKFASTLASLSRLAHGARMVNRGAHLVGHVMKVGRRMVTVTAEMAEHVGKILPYSQAQRLTKGFDHAIEAHHLIPKRYKEFFPHLNDANAPAVVLLWEQHRHEIERAIRAAERKHGIPSNKAEVRRVLEEAYQSQPEFLNAIREFF